MPEGRVQRDHEHAAGSPLEAVGFAVAGHDRGAAVSGQDVDRFLVQMALRRRRGARLHLDYKHRYEIAASLQVHSRAVRVETRPRFWLDLEQVDAEVLDHGDAFLLYPFEVGVPQNSELIGRLRLGSV